MLSIFLHLLAFAHSFMESATLDSQYTWYADEGAFTQPNRRTIDYVLMDSRTDARAFQLYHHSELELSSNHMMQEVVKNLKINID